jgi:hypothetical protein
MNNIVQYIPEHLELMEISANEKINFGMLRAAHGITLICDDKIIACGGIEKLWGNVGELWMVTSIHIEKHPKLLYNVCNDYIDLMSNVYDRIQIHVRSDFAKAVKFAENLGFEREALLERYGANGENYYLYRFLV